MSRILTELNRSLKNNKPALLLLKCSKLENLSFLLCKKPFCISTQRNEKLSYSNTPGDSPLLGQTVGNVIDRAASVYGRQEAVVISQTNIRKNFVQLKQDVDKFAAGLLALGLNRGDRIGIWSPSNYEWLLTQYGAAKAGLILVNINPAYQPQELDYCLKKVGVRAIVAAETYKTQNYYEILQVLFPSIATNVPGQTINNAHELSHVIMIAEKDYGGAFKFSDVMNVPRNTDFEHLERLQHEIQFDDAVNIQFTSGTTGKPKGATLTHFNLVNNSYIVGRGVRYHQETHRICISVPLYHCFGCVLGSLSGIMFGACQVYPSPTFNAKASAEAIHREKCTSLYGTPTMFIDLLHLPDLKEYDFSSVKTGIMAGATCPIEVVKSTMTTLNARDMSVCYGCTETSPIVTQTSPSDSPERRATTIGSALQHTELKLVDPATNRVVPRGKPGELWARGYMVMLGYWDEPEKTQEAITNDRWYKTGDLAEMDEDGYIKIIGRIKDMIIRGGENIYPREIEEFLYTHPKIADIQIVGVPDKRMGEELCAWIRLKTGETMNEQDVKEFCKGKIAHFKVPRYFKFVDSFPTTVTGKIQKYLIREMASKELGLK